MRLRFRDAVVWRYAIASISKIIEEAGFKVDPEKGLVLRAMDPSTVVLVEFTMPRDAFSIYEVEGERFIGVNMEELAKVLKRARKGDELLLEVSGDGRLSVVFEGRGSRRFTLPSIELTHEELPEVSFEVGFKGRMLPKVFRDVISEVEPVSDAVEFSAVKGEGKLVVASRSEVAEAEIELSASEGALIEHEITEDSRAKYTVDYLTDISSASQAAELMSVEFGNDTPLKLTYELSGGGRLVFYVAPREE
ncbi:DNA polymerase sliding clamp [Desulfurococcus mucosus]|uniref:DNA polymerase sliding clamp n=1 Tax=Desulfurococcus mucosus (strain ATCC 35584 / DSM 2162 / JCM 9187 / O7/1) TaxID=765177 RepID=E8RAF3_DESM0|nr:DNA polymerase sliding clamp [Desulfurococcus mucosus]ADV64363.1 proliferating cell nuclear antigen PcnA [Desulfurococcus mucosus DSM 2162]